MTIATRTDLIPDVTNHTIRYPSRKSELSHHVTQSEGTIFKEIHVDCNHPRVKTKASEHVRRGKGTKIK